MRRENGACCFVRDVRSDVAGGEGGGERDWANKWSDLALSSDEPRHASPRWIISARRRQRRTRSAHTHGTVSPLLLHFVPLLRLSQSPPEPSVCCSALASFSLRSRTFFVAVSHPSLPRRSAAQRQRQRLLPTVSLRTSEPLAWGGSQNIPPVEQMFRLGKGAAEVFLLTERAAAF